MGAFAFVDFCLLAAGAILIAFSEIWRQPNLMFNFTLSNEMLTGASPPESNNSSAKRI